MTKQVSKEQQDLNNELFNVIINGGKLEETSSLLGQGAYLEITKIVEASKTLSADSYVITSESSYFIKKIYKYLGEFTYPNQHNVYKECLESNINYFCKGGALSNINVETSDPLISLIELLGSEI